MGLSILIGRREHGETYRHFSEAAFERFVGVFVERRPKKEL